MSVKTRMGTAGVAAIAAVGLIAVAAPAEAATNTLKACTMVSKDTSLCVTVSYGSIMSHKLFINTVHVVGPTRRPGQAPQVRMDVGGDTFMTGKSTSIGDTVFTINAGVHSGTYITGSVTYGDKQQIVAYVPINFAS